MDTKEEKDVLERLIDVAGASALLVREGVIKRENYEKCLYTWISKQPEGNKEAMRFTVTNALRYERVVAALKE